MSERTKIQVRRIQSSEWETVVPLFGHYRAFYKQPSNIERERQFIQARLENCESVIFAAFANEAEDDVAIGFTQLYPTFSSVRIVKNWILNDLYVDEKYRKLGVGRQLIQAAMDFAKTDNAEFVQLETAVDNYTAQRLYEAIGFLRQERDDGFSMYRIKVS